MATFIRICQWDEFQHYKDRDPPWIKLHRKLLTSQTWVTLDDASRVLAVALMLLAAGTDNKIPSDPTYLKRVAYLNTEPNIQPLVSVRFIDLIDENGILLAGASGALANGTKRTSDQIRSDQSRSDTTASPTPAQPDVSREAKQSSRQIKPLPPEWLLDFKLAYPERTGDQGWRKAEKAARARLAEGHTAAEMIAGAKRYAAFAAATGKNNTEFVKQAATFLGPDKHFLEPWTIPAAARKSTGPLMPDGTAVEWQ